MSTNNARTWSLTLLGACLLSLLLGLSLGYALFGPGDLPWATQEAAAPAEEIDAPDTPVSDALPEEPPSTLEAVPASDQEPAKEPVWAARHLFIALNGQWVADGTKEFLKEIRPGGVILRDVNLRSRSQTISLVNEIKTAAGMGIEVYDLPLIGVAQEGGDRNGLALKNAPSAAQVAEYRNDGMAEELGRVYGEEARARGIGIVLAPVLDISEPGGIYPSLEQRTFGTDQKMVTSLGLAMAEGLRNSGVIPVAKHFPGYGIASFGTDGITVVLNKDVSGLARAMYPFNEAVRRGIEGIIVGHVALPALDKDFPERSAALSPVIVNELLRVRWGYNGVVLADEIALNEMINMHSVNDAVVEALQAGCDAVLFLDPNPNRIRAACHAIEQAVWDGKLSREQLAASAERLDQWRAKLGADLTPEPEPVLVAEAAPESVTADAAAEPSTDATPAPEPSEPPVIPEESAPEPTQSDVPMVVAQGDTGTAEVSDIPAESDANLENAAANPPESASDNQPAMKEATPPVDVPPETDSAGDSEVAPPDVAPDTNATDSSATDAASPDASEPTDRKLSEADRLILAQAAEQLMADMKAEEAAAKALAEEAVPEAVNVPAEETDDPAPNIASPEANTDAPPETSERTEMAKVESPPIPAEGGPAAAEADTAATEDTPSAPVAEEDPEENLSGMTHLRHEVKFGESLLQISWYYGVAAEDIARWNKLESMSVDHGDMLDIYVVPEESKAESVPAETVAEASPDAQTGEVMPEPAPETKEPEADSEPASETPTGEKVIHTVVVGDTLMSLARTYNVKIQQIRDWNGMTSDTLRLDAKLTVYPGPPKEATPDDENTTIYEVQPGDSLGRIANEHQTTRKAIMELNGITNPDHVWVGQKLKIPIPE
jgi:beta-N-acetylhexosaminidase